MSWYLILDFDHCSPCSPVNAVREISVTDRVVVVVFEFIAAMLSIEDWCIDVRLVVLNTHIECMVLLWCLWLKFDKQGNNREINGIQEQRLCTKRATIFTMIIATNNFAFSRSTDYYLAYNNACVWFCLPGLQTDSLPAHIPAHQHTCCAPQCSVCLIATLGACSAHA